MTLHVVLTSMKKHIRFITDIQVFIYGLFLYSWLLLDDGIGFIVVTMGFQIQN